MEWKDVWSVKVLMEDNIKYIYNGGNEKSIYTTIALIDRFGWNMSPVPTGNKVSLVQFKELLDKSYPLSNNVLEAILELDEQKSLNPSFIRDVFVSNIPFSYTMEQRIEESNIPQGIKNQIIDANDNFVDAPNHLYEDFLNVFPDYNSLYEKLSKEEVVKLESGMDPADEAFDNDPVRHSFERLIMNDKYEIWVEGRLYKLYEDCKAIAMQATIDDAYEQINILNEDGGPNIPMLDETPAGVSQEVIDGIIPPGYIVYNPLEFDPLGNTNDDPNYNTALQVYNLVEGCPVSNFTYSMYTLDDLSVDFSDMTNFNNIVQPIESFYQYWNFGDGTGSFLSDPTHTFPDYGNYTVSLTTFNADCGCWHVHKVEIALIEPQFREGNPDCPITVDPVINWNSDPMSVNIVVSPGTAQPPNTYVVNNHFQIFTQIGTLVHEENTSLFSIFYTFANEGVYNVQVTSTWDGGCVSISDMHEVTIIESVPSAECCDRRDSENETFQDSYNNDNYKLKICDLARGSFGTQWWRTLEGEQKLYRKQSGKLFYKKFAAYHQILIGGLYYDRILVQGKSECLDGYQYYRPTMTCTGEWDNWWNNSMIPFPNKFGLDSESMIYTHRVYLGGSWQFNDPPTGFQYDCYNSGGYLLFDEEIKLGDCD